MVAQARATSNRLLSFVTKAVQRLSWAKCEPVGALSLDSLKQGSKKGVRGEGPLRCSAQEKKGGQSFLALCSANASVELGSSPFGVLNALTAF